MSKHAEQAHFYETLARRLEYQQRLVLRAVDLLRDELKTSRCDGRTQAHLAVRLHFLRRELDASIPIKVAAARFLATIPKLSSMRGSGRPAATVVNACLAELVEELRHAPRPMAADARRTYVAILAQACGWLDSSLKDPGEALRKRLGQRTHRPNVKQLKALQDLCLSFPDRVSNKPRSVAEAAAEALEVVQGRWPVERDLPEPEYWISLESAISPDPKGRKSVRSKQSGRRGRNRKPPV